jgi:hypothetical protein
VWQAALRYIQEGRLHMLLHIGGQVQCDSTSDLVDGSDAQHPIKGIFSLDGPNQICSVFYFAKSFLLLLTFIHCFDFFESITFFQFKNNFQRRLQKKLVCFCNFWPIPLKKKIVDEVSLCIPNLQIF